MKPGVPGDVKRVGFIVCVVTSLAAGFAAHAALPGDVTFERVEWSPVRGEIAFWATVEEQTLCGSGERDTALFVVHPDGSELRRVDGPPAPNRWDDVDSSTIDRIWSPDGSKLAFTGIYYRGREDRYVVVVTPTGDRVLTWGYADANEWAPDSKRLAVFMYDPTASPTGPAIFDLRTTKHQEIGPYLSSGLLWSPLGRLVAYEHEQFVYVERPDGTHRHRLARGFVSDWSGDGRLLSFVRAKGKRHSAGFVIRPDGRDVRPMPGAPKEWTWSPRGQTYAFARDLYDFKTGRRWHVLARTVAPTKPTWSPNGRRLAYPRMHTLFIVDRDGRHGHRIGWGEALRVSDPSWSPDSRTLTFATEDGLYVIGADGRHGHYVPLDLCRALKAGG